MREISNCSENFSVQIDVILRFPKMTKARRSDFVINIDASVQHEPQFILSSVLLMSNSQVWLVSSRGRGRVQVSLRKIQVKSLVKVNLLKP